MKIFFYLKFKKQICQRHRLAQVIREPVTTGPTSWDQHQQRTGPYHTTVSPSMSGPVVAGSQITCAGLGRRRCWLAPFPKKRFIKKYPNFIAFLKILVKR